MSRRIFTSKRAEIRQSSGFDPIELASNYGFKAHELNELKKIIQEHQTELLEAWHEHLD